jgi:dihydrofolate reductase
MRKVIAEQWISLDGHVSDREGQLNFFASTVRGSYGARQAFLENVDGILLGRKTYEAFAQLWPERPIENDALAAMINQTKRIVLSDTLTHAPWGKWNAAEIMRGDVTDNLKKLKAMPGKDIVLWGSISLVQAFMKENLVDELHLHLCPVLTGGGRKLFEDTLLPQSLTLIESKPFDNGNVLLKYKVAAN